MTQHGHYNTFFVIPLVLTIDEMGHIFGPEAQHPNYFGYHLDSRPTN